MLKLHPVEQKSNEVRTPLRYLVLGSTGYGGVDCADWVEGGLPNLIDYDLIIVDVPALTPDKLASADLNRLDQIRTQFVQLLHSEGTIIIITCPMISHKRPNRYPEIISNYHWSPIAIRTNLEKGKSIVKKEEEFITYLSLLSDWDYLFFIPNDCLSDALTQFYGPPHKTRYRIPCKPILENRYGKALAQRCHIEVYYERTTSGGYFGSPHTEYPKTPDNITEDIILLPRIQGIDNRKAVSLIIEEITGICQETLSPQWAEKIVVPGVPDLIAQVDEGRRQIKAFEGEIRILNEKIESLNEYKRLLYSSGKKLENIVERCFKDLGGKIIPAKHSQEEFVLVYKGNEYPVEVKGVSKSIALSHLRQISDYLLRYEEETGKGCKGILFGNAWCTLPPQNRDNPETLVFPDNIRKRAEQLDISLVSSIKFFEAFIYFLEHGHDDSLLSNITEQKWIIQFLVA